MKKIMLVLLSYAGTDNVLDRLSDILTENDSLYVAGVVIKEISPSFSSLISDIGFLGDKVVNDVEETVGNIYQKNAGSHLDEIEDKYNKQGVNVIKDKVTDDELTKIKKILVEKDFDKIIINYTKNKYIIHSEINIRVKELFHNNDTSVEVYYDGIK